MLPPPIRPQCPSSLSTSTLYQILQPTIVPASDPHARFYNWSKTFTCVPLITFEPSNIEECRLIFELARREDRTVRIVGSGLSPSDVGCTTEFMIRTHKMNKIRAVRGLILPHHISHPVSRILHARSSIKQNRRSTLRNVTWSQKLASPWQIYSSKSQCMDLPCTILVQFPRRRSAVSSQPRPTEPALHLKFFLVTSWLSPSYWQTGSWSLAPTPSAVNSSWPHYPDWAAQV